MLSYHMFSTETLHENRDRLLAALAALNIQSAVIDYTGGGDSGDISEVSVSPPDLMTSLAQAAVALRCIRGEWRDGKYHPKVEDQSIPLRQALEDFTLDWVNATHGGWENNEGGQGTVVINVAENTFTLEHTEFYTESHCYEYAL